MEVGKILKKARARDGDGDGDTAEDPRKGKAPLLEAAVEGGSSSGGQAAVEASDPCEEDPRDWAAVEIGGTDGERCMHSSCTTDAIETIVSQIARAPICDHEMCLSEDDPRDWPAVAIRDTDGARCKHNICNTYEIETIVSAIDAYGGRAQMCGHETCRNKGRSLVMVCSECDRYFCIGGKANKAKPQGHIREHSMLKAHWVALRYKDPYVGYCFKCEDSVTIGGEGEEGMMVDDEDGCCVSGVANGHGYVIRGIPNFGNTCYLNALLQCLLVIGKLRARMFGPGAPSGFLAGILHDLFVDTNSKSYNTLPLDPRSLLACVRKFKPEFRGSFMQDSHEFLYFLLNRLNEEEKIMRPVNMQQGAPSAAAPTAVDSIFGGQLSDTISCKRCAVKSVSHVPFYDLSVPLPPKGTPAKSVSSPSRNERCISQQNIVVDLFPVDKTNTEKIHTISEGGDPQVPASESEDIVMVKTSELLKVDSNHLTHNSQSKDDVHGRLQAPIRKEKALIGSGCDVARTNSAVIGNVFNGPEITVEAKVGTFSAQVTAEDKGKAHSHDIVSDEAEDINSLASIEECLELHMKAEIKEWTCENCSKVAQKESTISDGEQEVACTNVNRTIDGDQAKQSERKSCQSEQSCDLIRLDVECSSSSRQPHVSDAQHQVLPAVDMKTKGDISGMSCGEKDSFSCSIVNKKPECLKDSQEDVPSCHPAGKLYNLLGGQGQNTTIQDQGRGNEINLGHSAHQMEENQYDRHDRNEGAIQTCLISKLPAILVIQLKRFLGPLKVSGHVSFKEILDMKVFLHPSSEDKDNSSYYLVGVVEHQGLGKDEGHYVAYVRPSHPQQTDGSSSWFRASDADVREISLEEVLMCEAYLLFYERMG